MAGLVTAGAGDGARKPVKALVRGLQVLAAANDMQVATVSAVVATTKLPKATVIRLIQTLVDEGYLDELASGEGYRVTPKVGALSRAMVGNSTYQQAVQPILDRLAARIKWPSEFFLRDGHSMVIEVSNRSVAPIKLRLFERRRFPIVRSATGIAYLSAMPAKRVGEILAEIIGRDYEGDADSDIAKEVTTKIGQAKRRGYALVEYPDIEAGLRVASVPVMGDDGPVGGLSVLHIRDVLDERTLNDTVLPKLRDAAARISKAIVRGKRG